MYDTTDAPITEQISSTRHTANGRATKKKCGLCGEVFKKDEKYLKIVGLTDDEFWVYFEHVKPCTFEDYQDEYYERIDNNG